MNEQYPPDLKNDHKCDKAEEILKYLPIVFKEPKCGIKIFILKDFKFE